MINGPAMSEICRKLAEAAASSHHDILAQILRMAALEAAETGARYAGPASNIREQLVGTWDWDLLSNRVYADGPAARLFNISEEQGALGSPIEKWLAAVHPDDAHALTTEIARVMKTGDVFSMEYRIIADDRVHWVYARGRCTFDDRGYPVRFPGAFVDITSEKVDDSMFSIAPQ
jgi:PAS domain-containing protein